MATKDLLHTVLIQRTDYLSLIAATLLVFAIVYYRFRPGRQRAIIWALFGLSILGAGWFFVEESAQHESTRLEAVAIGYAPVFADGLGRLGHEEITAGTAAHDPHYWQLIKAERRWLAENPEIGNILTFRKSADGRLAVVVDSKPDQVPGAASGPEAPGKKIGTILDRDFSPAMEKAFSGVRAFHAEPTTDNSGTWVTALAPLRNFRGDVEAVVAVDFPAAPFLAAIGRARHLATGCVAAALLIIALGGAAVSRGAATTVPVPAPVATPVVPAAPITPAAPAAPAQPDCQDVASIDRQKLETLVDSIDGIVFESDVATSGFTFVSRQCERLLGYTPAQCLANKDFWSSRLDPVDQWVSERRRKLIDTRVPYSLDYRVTAPDGRTVWIREKAAVMLDAEKNPRVVRGVFYDITEMKSAASELEKANAALVESSRFAGMAEVATGVLHNVGNVLNSVNVSGNVISERLRRSKVIELGKVAGLLTLQSADFAGFVARDPRGPHIPELISCVADALRAEHADLLEEVESITRNIGHIKEIVSMQQGFAKGHGITEPLVIQALVDDAIKINSVSFTRHRITVVQAYEEVPEVLVDKHLVLQILVNLLRNAKQAIEASELDTRRIVVKIQKQGPDFVRIAVQDSGTGIAPEHLTRVFSHGFTTKKTGHGFGLHASALAATGMGGSLQAHSEGPGTGATFFLDLPLAVPVPAAVAA